MARLSMADRLKKSGTATVARLDDARAKLKNQSKPSADKQHSNQHTEQHSNQHSGGQTDTLTDTLTHTLTDTLADSQPNTPSSTQPGTPDIKPVSTQAIIPNSIHTSTPNNTLNNTPVSTLPSGPGDDYLWMTPNQAKVLLFVCQQPAGRSQLREISLRTGVKYGTVRTSLDSLYQHGCITRPRKIRVGQWQGLHIELLDAGKNWINIYSTQSSTPISSLFDIPNSTPTSILPSTLINTLPITQNSVLNNTHDNRHSGTHSDTPASYNSSSSLLNKTTTIPTTQKLDSHPELGYWRQKGLKSKQVQTWMQEFDLSENDIIESLCFCKFDMVNNGREEKDNIRDVFDWFYRIVQKAGAYPKPNNYKSHQELQIEREKARLEELKRQAEELRKIRQEATKAEFGLQFEQMLQNPEDPVYQECYEKLPPMMKKRGKKGSIAFESAMKAEFCRLNDIEDC